VSDDESSRFSISVAIPMDGHSCVRRECPSCGLQFKSNGAEHRMDDVVGWSVGQILRSHGGDNSGHTGEGTGLAHCPYCGHSVKSQDFLHPEHWSYLKKLVFREYVEPLFGNMIESAFGGLRDSSFVRVTHEVGPRSVRPVVGPEPTDMVRVRCIGCSELFKVTARWRGSVRCTGCGADLLPM
jgi:hypothetical protein